MILCNDKYFYGLMLVMYTSGILIKNIWLICLIHEKYCLKIIINLVFDKQMCLNFMVKCSFKIILYVKIFLSQSVPPLLNYTTIQSPLLSKCKFILKYLNLIFGIDFVW